MKNKLRKVHALPLDRGDGWTIKPYVIAHDPRRTDIVLDEAAIDLARRTLAEEAANNPHHGVAFTIEHQTERRDYLLLCWWINRNELRHRLFVRNGMDEPYRPAPATHSIACVWELDVIAFESEAWFETVTCADKAAGTGPYIRRRLEGRVPRAAANGQSTR